MENELKEFDVLMEVLNEKSKALCLKFMDEINALKPEELGVPLAGIPPHNIHLMLAQQVFASSFAAIALTSVEVGFPLTLITPALKMIAVAMAKDMLKGESPNPSTKDYGEIFKNMSSSVH